MVSMTRLILTLLIAGLPLSVLAAEIYKEVDEDGVPTFSDQKLPGGEVIELREPMIFSPKEMNYSRDNTAPKVEERETVKYFRLDIESPASGEAIRENSGALTLEIVISPGTPPGHTAELLMDGVSIRRLAGSGPVSLSNVDRGTHEFRVRIVDESGEIIQAGPISSISMLRYSKLNRAN
jgi:hypothetical protein